MKTEVLLIDLVIALLDIGPCAVPKESSVSELARACGDDDPPRHRPVRTGHASSRSGLDQGRSFRKDLMPDYKANRPEKDQSIITELRKLQERLLQRRDVASLGAGRVQRGWTT